MKHKRHKKRKPAREPRAATEPQQVQAMGGYEATRYTSAREFSFWPSLNPCEEVDAWDRDKLWRAARSLYANTAEARMVVRAAVMLMGWLMPLPSSSDAEWNRLAERAFLARVNNPSLFEASGRLSWKAAQLWIENRAIIDGDSLTVLARASDGGGDIRLYAAPQICGEGEGVCGGCKLDAAGRITDYRVVSYTGGQEAGESWVPARSAILYHHHPDPAAPRGISELATAIPTAQDLAEINGYHKVSAKLSASIAWVETKDKDDKHPGQSRYLPGQGGQPQGEEAPLTVAGNKALSLAPGRKLEILHDHRPSVEVREFCHDLVRALAWAFGLDPELVYYVLDMGSAGARLSLQKIREWIAGRLIAREAWCNRVYQHIIALEVKAGRLPVCPAADWQNVQWIPRRDMTIDVGREGALAINLIREGLADADAWTLSTTGMTFEQIVRRRARNLAQARKVAQEYGLTLEQLLPGKAQGGSLAAASPDNPDPLEDEQPESIPSEKSGTASPHK